HLGIDAEDRRVFSIVAGADAGVPGLDRLRHRLVLQRSRDAPSANAAPRSRVRGRGHAANHGTVEHRAADDLISLASNPEAIMADGWILEPVAPPLVECHLAFGHRARHIVRRLAPRLRPL